MWTWANAEQTVVTRDADGVTYSVSVNDPLVKAWLADGNIPAPCIVKCHSYSVPDRNDLPVMSFVNDHHGVRCTHYHFSECGQRLPWHDHRFAHWSVVLKGSFKIEISGQTDHILRDPIKDCVLFPAGIRHQITALEDHSSCLQIQLDGFGS